MTQLIINSNNLSKNIKPHRQIWKYQYEQVKISCKNNQFLLKCAKNKINLVTENYEMHNFIIKSIFICININGIEHDISLKMLTF